MAGTGRLDAESLALRALAYLAADPDAVGRFLAGCGADPAALRARAADPEFLGFVLDHILSEDESVISFAAYAGIDPMDVVRARAKLPGGDTPHWT